MTDFATITEKLDCPHEVIGPCLLINADCLQVLPLLEAGSVDAVVTDPPYGINLDYATYSDTHENWVSLLRQVIPLCRRIGRFVVMPCGPLLALRQTYIDHNPDWLIAWVKGSPGTRSPIGFNSWEPHLCWGKPAVAMHDVFQTRCGFEIKGHPCPKPVAWALWLVERAAGLGGTVIDPFMGSGTTGVACVRTGRRFVGVEIDPGYYTIARKRILDEIALRDGTPGMFAQTGFLIPPK